MTDFQFFQTYFLNSKKFQSFVYIEENFRIGSHFQKTYMENWKSAIYLINALIDFKILSVYELKIGNCINFIIIVFSQDVIVKIYIFLNIENSNI